MSSNQPNSISWIDKESDLINFADFFYTQLQQNTDYISHGEIQSGRSNDGKTWSENLKSVIRQEFVNVTQNKDRSIAGVWNSWNAPVGAAVVYWATSEQMSYAVLEDIIISETVRGQGIGKQLANFITNEVRARNLDWIFLESGLNNHQAHEFIEHIGFEKISYNFAKKIL